MKKLNRLEDLEKWRQQILVSRSKKSKKILKTVVLSCGTCGQASGSLEVLEAFKKQIEARHLEEKIEVKVTGCHGFCEMEPNIIIEPDKIFYKQIKPKDVPLIIEKTLLDGEIIPELVYQDPLDGRLYPHQPEIPFYRRQLRWLTEANFYLDPTSLEDYIAHGGYEALVRVLESFDPEQVIEEIMASGLRGRGGAGFPTGRKWKICREAPGDLKFIICNADEGDPGAYMDRSLLEGNPHSVLEGMIIGAYAIGAREGFVYVRMEYPLAVKHVTLAIEQAREAGLLGESILGTSFSFDLHIVQGAGAFVSGEETSLMASIEGRRAFPRQRPPFPAQSGLWGYPTNINNVETWANVPLIIKKGASWFNQVGTEGSKGTKIFSLVGKINNTGLVEVPMGITLREIIYEVGGGIKGGLAFKAIQTGGPSGGCLPSSLLDLPVDYDTLTRAGSIMGSGGMIVMDEATCMVDVARYFLNFTQEESCGKCVPCRIGTRQMVDILNRIVAGQGEEGDFEKLENLAQTVKNASLCGLGQTAPNPVLTTLKYFRDEYEAHIREKSCPALVCKDLIIYYIEPELCVGCLLCLKSCPSGAISGERKKPHYIDQSLCIKCGACFEKCPKKVQAIKKYTGKKRDEILSASRAIKNSRVGL